MFQIRDFQFFACQITMGYFEVCEDFKPLVKEEEVNLWKLPFKSWFANELQNVHSKLSCHDCFIASYWICFLMSMYGLVEAAYEFIRLYTDETYEPTTFWNRSHNHFTQETRRKARFIGSILNIATYFFMLYGFISFRSWYITGWLLVNGAIVPLETFIWLSQIAVHKKTQWKPLISIMILTIRFALTFHVMLMMQELVVEP